MISRERLAKANAHGLRRAKALAYGVDIFTDHWKPIDKQRWIERSAKLLRKTTKRCSGPCCGNPRKHFGERTLQERKHELAEVY